jgi:hypothetical protein
MSFNNVASCFCGDTGKNEVLVRSIVGIARLIEIEQMHEVAGKKKAADWR